MNLGENVWGRTDSGPDVLTPRGYVAATSGFTALGLAFSAWCAIQTMTWQLDIWSWLGIGLGVPIIGIFVALGSSNWVISLVGYLMVVTGLGIITGPTVAMFETATVMSALLATGGVTVVMSAIGIMYPKSLSHWGSYLFGGLVALLFVRFGQIFLAGMGVEGSLWNWPIIDYAAAVLFSLYIVYDWNRAVRLRHTMDNAVDCALAIYLDIANLFIIFLRIMGGNYSRN